MSARLVKVCGAAAAAIVAVACTAPSAPSRGDFGPSVTASTPPSSVTPPSSETPTPPPAAGPTGPAAVVTVAPVTGPPAAVELASPESAAVAWLSRWCAYDWRSPLGTSENAARTAMTQRAWLRFDPLTTPAAAGEWALVVANRQSAACSAPTVIASPNTARTAAEASLVVTAQRVVTPQGGAPRVEVVRQSRRVSFEEGRWLVDDTAPDTTPVVN